MSRSSFGLAYGPNFWSRLDDILVDIRPTSSKDIHHGWFLGRWFVIVKIDINQNWISATSQSIRLSLSEIKLLNVHILQLILWLIIDNKPKAKLHYLFCLALQKKSIISMPSDCVWFAHGSRASLKIASNDLSLRVSNDVITSVNAVRDLGVTLDSELTMQRHVNKVASACFYHIRRLKQIRRLIGPEVTATLMSAFILSKLDYYTTLY